MQDAVSKSRQARGSALPHTKLSELDISIIIKRGKSGEKYKSIAKDFGVTPQNIGKILIKIGVRRYVNK